MYRRKRIVRKNEYLRTVFKDEEIYHAAFVEMKQGSVWKQITTWNTTNANFFKLDFMPYPLVGRFKELCAMYRWVKFNYVSFYFAVSGYSFTGNSDMQITLTEDVQSPKVSKFTGKINQNQPFISTIRGADKFHFVWNLDNVIKEETASLNYFEASLHKKSAVINENKYVKFFFRIPKDDRRFIGTDHATAVSAAQDLDSYLKNVLGTKYRRVPTAIYGASDDFTTFLRYNYIQYQSSAHKNMREPACRLGIHTKIYVGCTFKTMKDI